MEKDAETNSKPVRKNRAVWLVLGVVVLICVLFYFYSTTINHKISTIINNSQVKSAETLSNLPPELDFAAYDKKLNLIANNPVRSSTTPTSTITTLWPVKTAYPNVGAILPFNRVVAYYGNLYSKGMGVLGEYSEDEMLNRLNDEVKKWQAADPSTPVVPALHYIAVVAQAGPGRDGKYRSRMPDSEIDKVLKMAEKNHGIVFLDIQVGLSNVQTEVPLLEKYLKMPNVHLGIDPEFSMKSGAKPGTEIGTLDAEDINFAVNYLSRIVKENNLTPKILVVHRFTQKMLTNYQKIQTLPEVQIVMNMDGFGGQGNKINTYKQFVYKEPVQFTGFKLFYKNDVAKGEMLTPEQLLKLTPIPVYIQYQ